DLVENSIQVYLEATGNGGLTIVDATVDDVTGQFKLGATANFETAYLTDFVAAHPDGTYLYAGRTDLGKYGEYLRDTTDGSLSTPCTDTNGSGGIFNKMLVSPDGMYLYVLGEDELKAYRTHTEVPMTPSPTEAPTPNPVPPTSSPTVGPTPSPTPFPTPTPNLDSAILSDTQAAFSLAFSSTCYCVEENGRTSSGDVAVCGFNTELQPFDQGCDVSRLLDESTLYTFGNQSTCEWSEDSLMAVVTYDEPLEESRLTGVNVTLAGGYILGGIPSKMDTLEFAEGTVVLQGRTAAPELLEAKFSDAGDSIFVIFSPEGSAANSLLDASDAALGSGPGSCGSLLNASSIPPLGEGATCEWIGERELSVVLGNNAYVVPDEETTETCASPISCITLLEGGIKTEAFAILSSVGSTQVLPPDNPPGVSAVLIAPQTVGLCGILELDGRASSGALSRPLSTWWNVSATSSMRTNVESSLAFFEGSLVAELNASALEAGIEHTFALTAENFLGDTDVATVKVARIAEDIPSVVVLGAASRVVTRSRSISLRMAATPPACAESQLLTYSWSEAGGSGHDELGTEAFQGLAQVDATTLTLPAFTLGYPGSSYLFAASATSQTSGTSSSATVEVTVEQGVVRASIQGGQFRQHTAGGDLVLDGSDSLDEDDIAELSLRYEWWCSQNCTSVQDDWTTYDDGSVVVIPSPSLESGTIYEFALTVSTGSADSSDVYGLLRSDTTSVRVQVVAYEAPEVFVLTKENSLKHDPTRKVVVYGSAGEQASSYDFLWTQTAGDLDVEEHDWSTLFATAQSGLNLVVRPNVLTGGSTYTFRLSATDVTSQATGFAELSVVMNAAPTGGYVGASPRAGRAAVDVFYLESLGWTDDVEDLPLTFSFSFINGQDQSAQQRGLSMFASESPEWKGSLPIGQSTSNYTMLIVGHVSDAYGATSTSISDATGMAVTVRVTKWTPSSGDSTLFEAYTATQEETRDTPGRATTTVRAYSSLLVQQVEEISQQPDAEFDLYLELLESMVEDVTSDFEALEFSATTAGAVLDTLALVSGGDIPHRTDSQVAALSSSAGVLDRAIGEGSWDSRAFSPVLELLDHVLGAFNASGGVIGREDLGETATEVLPGMMTSMMSLMESDLEDGEDAMVIANEYVHVLCLVTSTTDAMSFDAGSSHVLIPAGVTDHTSQRRERRRLSTSFSKQANSMLNGSFARRRLDSSDTAATSTVAIANFQFNARGPPSNEVDAGITSITITTSSDTEDDFALRAPVRMTMTGSMSATLPKLPSCVYYNDDAGAWDTGGLATGASVMSVDEVTGETARGDANVTVTCVSFHLSDFTIATDEVGAAFRPIEPTAGLAVVLRARDISKMGMILLLMALLLLVVARIASRMADAKNKLDRQLAGKTDAYYISTGESLRYPTLLSVLVEAVPPDARYNHRQRRKARRRARKRGVQMLRRHLARRLRGWGRRVKIFLRLVLMWHPWFGIVSPTSSSLVLTREQLSVLIFAQIMVHMMVEALLVGNSSDYRIRVAHVVASLVISMPASIIIPQLFAAASAPPPSKTTNSVRKSIVPSTNESSIRAQGTARAKTHTALRYV
ncbi:unnamed protein product, partial [Hapterophycus canaliculatus]